MSLNDTSDQDRRPAEARADALHAGAGNRRGPRRLAVVTYYFPPLGGVGVQRILKHATYLPRFGWEPVTFTPDRPAYEIRDPDLEGAVPPGLEVQRSFIIEPRHLYERLVSLARLGRTIASKVRRRGHPDVGADRPNGPLPQEPPKADAKDGGRWLRLLAALRNLVFFPDEQLAWLPFAVRSIRASARSRRFDAVLSSSPPVTTHLIAGLARPRGTPWIADFRDPWIGNGFAPELPWLHRRLMTRLERWIVQRADVSIFTTARMREAYAGRYPDLAERFVVITNGYDLNDLSQITPGPVGASTTFRLVYAGSLYGDVELDAFLVGLSIALARRPELRTTLRVEFIGWLSRANQAVAARAMRSDVLAGVVAFKGFRPRADALADVASADACLLILADKPGRDLIIPVKLFEYLGLDRPVLAVVPSGAVAEALSELDWGVVVPPKPDSIADGIDRIIDAPCPRRSADPDHRYERVVLAARLAQILDARTESRGGFTSR